MSSPDDDRPAPAADHPTGLLAPSTLKPVDVDLRAVFWAVTAGFAVALVVTGCIGLVGSIPGRTVAICATGVGLGLLAQGWVRWREAADRRRARAQG